MYKRMIIYTCLLLFSVVAALHLALLYRPDMLRAKLRESTVQWLFHSSPIFKRLGVRACPAALLTAAQLHAHACAAFPQLSLASPGAGHAAAAASSGRFDEL